MSEGTRVCNRCKWRFIPKRTWATICEDCTPGYKAEVLGPNIKDIMRHKYWALQMKWALEDG